MHLRLKSFALCAMGIGIISFQENLKLNYEESHISKSLKKKVEEQLNSINVKYDEKSSLDIIEDQYIENLRKDTANWVRQVNILRKEDNMQKHLKIGGLFSIGNLLCPQIFIPTTFFYLMVSQTYFLKFLLKAKKDKDFAKSLNFKSFYDIYFDLTKVLLVIGAGKICIQKFQAYNQSRALVKK